MIAIISSFLMGATVFPVAASAEEIVADDTVSIVSQGDVIVPYGDSAPSTSNVWTLPNGSYTGTIESFEYRVWTNYWYTGTSSITVSLQGANLRSYLVNTNPSVNRMVTITLYKKKLIGREEVGSITATTANPVSILSKTFNNLDSSAKYTVCVTKLDDDVHVRDLSLMVWGN